MEHLYVKFLRYCA